MHDHLDSTERRLTRFEDRYSKLELVIYGIFWLLMFLFPLLMELYDYSSGESLRFELQGPLRAYKRIVLFFCFFLLNNFLLFPKLFLNKKYLFYLILVLGCLGITWLLSGPPKNGMIPFIEGGPRPMRKPPIDVFRMMNVMIVLCLIFANDAIKLYLIQLRRDSKMLSLHNEQMRSELESLKYQVNPHFLMNSLNNIQALIDIDHDRAYEAIQQLSKLMRYVLYETGEQYVPLKKETQIMNNFIGLMRLRYPEDIDITTDFPESDESEKVPSLLFISFLENAFKHGIDYEKKSSISSSLRMKDEKIEFECVNTIASQPQKKEQGGFGIENVRRRLDLIYGKDYDLEIERGENQFKVHLIIPRNKKIEKC